MLLKRLHEEEKRSEPEHLRNPDRADLAWVYDQRQRNTAMREHTERQIKEIEGALKRIEAGTYGICTNCGRAIQPARLEAIPWAALCVECQQQREN